MKGGDSMEHMFEINNVLYNCSGCDNCEGCTNQCYENCAYGCDTSCTGGNSYPTY